MTLSLLCLLPIENNALLMKEIFENKNKEPRLLIAVG